MKKWGWATELGCQRWREMLVLDAIDQTAVVLAAQSAVLLVVERHAVAGALIAHEPDSIHIERTSVRATLAACDDPVGPGIANVDATE